MSSSLDTVSLGLLEILQRGVPLVDRPFLSMGTALGISERAAIERVAILRGKVIRQISAIFDSRALGYQSCLVAAKVDESLIDQAAARISEHPGVSHNYRRNHSFNLWYTLAVPPGSRFGLEGTVDILHERSGADSMRLLPALKMYKISVKFDLSGEADAVAREKGVVRAEFGVRIQQQRLSAIQRIVQRSYHPYLRDAASSPESLPGPKHAHG